MPLTVIFPNCSCFLPVSTSFIFKGGVPTGLLSLRVNAQVLIKAAKHCPGASLSTSTRTPWPTPFCCSVAQSCLTLRDPADCSPPGSSVLGDSPVKNTGVGGHFLLQGLFPAQGWKPRLLHWQAGSLPPSHLGSPHPTLDPQMSDVPHPRICALAHCVPFHLEAPLTDTPQLPSVPLLR